VRDILQLLSFSEFSLLGGLHVITTLGNTCDWECLNKFMGHELSRFRGEIFDSLREDGYNRF
jgi:hypothetical protein